MTRINRLTLQGFKSFADKVTITVPTGFTVICGPNGSGKSNICDAIMFALGISSARIIRAEKLSDLIFHGSKKRSPAKSCVVSIYIDNKDRKVPIEEDEIKITRKVNEKGLSIIRVNGKVVTRSKMLDLLANFNISPYGHNIIMQGDINKIIEMSPKERREIIDQISGIAEFDEKKSKSEAELEKVEKHIREMSIILSEKEKLLEKLKFEKEAAEKSVFLNREITKIRYSLALQNINRIKSELEKIEEKIKSLTREFEENEKLLKEKENEFKKYEKIAKEISDLIIQKARNIELIKRIDEINTEIIRRRDRIELNERILSRVESEPIIEKLPKIEGIIGSVSQLMKIPSQYSIAIKAAIGQHMNDIVVANEDVAIECIKFLKENKIGVARFLPLDKIRVKDHNEKIEGEIIGKAIELIEFDPKYKNIFDYLLGDTVIIENIEKKIKGARAVTLDGDIIEVYGPMIGGYNKRVEFELRLKKENEKMMKEIEDLEKELEVLREKQKEEEESIKKMDEERLGIHSKIEKMKKEIEDLQEKKSSIIHKINKLNIEKAKKGAELENYEKELENYPSDSFYDYPQEKLREMLSNYLRELSQLGAINMKAAEEFEILSVEYNELKNRLSKLIEERDAIIRAIQEIEGKKYEKFMETLNAISENFSVIYRDLMNGEGKLRLEEEGNIYSGLMIEASTESKKILNIDAMSGGEKTLTALAFLFAIQQYHASPFYILDEIDAALDKVNTKKVVEFLKKYSEKTQFIVITHNDLTIQAADHVFGVSMEDGVSKIFSIKMPNK
ncbi:MAG: AAA family ATPase [Candidatus Pacearchaeota archaeon]